MKYYFISSIVCLVVAIQCFGSETIFPDEILKIVDKRFTDESKKLPEIKISNKNDLRKVICYSGFLPEQVGIKFEIFPELRFIRVAATGNVNNPNWLYIQIDSDPPGKIGERAKDGSIRLRKDIKDKVMACGSGILFKDITSEKCLCKINNEYWVIARQTKSSWGKISEFKVLASVRSGESMLESISMFNELWSDYYSPFE